MTLDELAEDTLAYGLPSPGVERLDRGDLVFTSTENTANVLRVRLGDVAEAVEWARAQAARTGAPRLEWWVGWSATPADLEEQLVARGFVPDDEQPVLTGMTCDTPPPEVPGVDVLRIETLEDQLAVAEVDLEVWNYSAAEREQRRDVERRRFDPTGAVHHFGAYVDGRPVGFGRAVDMEGGVSLLGGAVLPEYRSRGVYRALVRARWDHAVSRGTPLLVVQAGHMSAPVLAGLGFRAHGDLHLYMDPAVAEEAHTR